MRKPIIYVAHPVSGDPLGNVVKVVDWIRWFTINDPDTVYVAPWVAEVLAFHAHQGNPDFYDRVLADDCRVLERLDGILLVGGRISRGMEIELHAAQDGQLAVVDWSVLAEPPHLGHTVPNWYGLLGWERE